MTALKKYSFAPYCNSLFSIDATPTWTITIGKILIVQFLYVCMYFVCVCVYVCVCVCVCACVCVRVCVCVSHSVESPLSKQLCVKISVQISKFVNTVIKA